MEQRRENKENFYFIAKYQQDKNNKENLNILGKEFIKKNINKCKLIYRNKKYKLKENFEDIDINYNHKDIIKLKFIMLNNIIDISYMFFNCNSLISLSASHKNGTDKNINIINMKYMLFGCKSLQNLPNFYLLNLIQNNIIFELTYKVDEKNKSKLKILGDSFIKYNKDKVIIIYNNYELELKKYYNDINNNQGDKIKILLCLDKNINSLYDLFGDCVSLISIEYFKINIESNDIENESNSISLDFINDRCDEYFSLCEYDKFSNISNINNNLFYFSSSISNMSSNTLKCISQPDISIFSKVEKMSSMFKGCKSLISLPDMSNWNTSNVEDMRYMFYGCKSLISLPDISNWNTSNVWDMWGLFQGCNSLISLPDISNWNTYNVEYFYFIFAGCHSLITLPDISNWNTSNVKNMSLLFLDCNSLISIPDISKWDTSKVTTLESMFKECKSLISLPDISKWDISKVETMNYMFLRCESLILLPDISKWDTKHLSGLGGCFLSVNH